MVRRLNGEELIPLREFPAKVEDSPPWLTLRSWAREGLCRGRVKLALTRIGGRWFLTESAYRSFLLQVRVEKARPKVRPEGARSYRRRMERAKRLAEVLDPRKKG